MAEDVGESGQVGPEAGPSIEGLRDLFEAYKTAQINLAEAVIAARQVAGSDQGDPTREIEEFLNVDIVDEDITNRNGISGLADRILKMETDDRGSGNSEDK